MKKTRSNPQFSDELPPETADETLEELASQSVEGEATVSEDGAEAMTEAADLADFIDPRDEQLAALTIERDALKDQLLRARAEFENYRKRIAREADRTSRAALESLLLELLPVVDNLELALQHAPSPQDSFGQGVELVLKQICEVLSRNGVEAIPAVGEPFNPHVHEAMTHVEHADVPENQVALEFQRGYRIADKVLRPTKVAVSRGKADDADIGDTK